MKCQRSRWFWVLSLALLFLSSAISAEVCLTDAEADELDQILVELAERSEQQQAELVTLGTSFRLSVIDLKTVGLKLTTSEQALEQAESSYKEDAIYWRRRERELKITTVLASIAAAAVGFLAGWIASR